MSDLEFQVARRRKQPITFKLNPEPHEYVFTPPKTAIMVLPIIDSSDTGEIELTRASFDWLADGLSEEDELRIFNRLRDPEDDLDVDTIQEVVTKLGEKVTARPTT